MRSTTAQGPRAIPAFSGRVNVNRLILYALLGLALRAAPGSARPLEDTTAFLVVDQRVLDFGTVAEHALREEVVYVTNSGQEAVQVLSTGADCKCLTSTLAVDILQPGQRTTWRVTLNVCSGYTGEVRRHVWLRTDQPKQPRLKLPVRYRVVRLLYAEPREAALGLLGHDTASQIVELKTLSETPVQLLGATCAVPGMVVELLDEVVTAHKPARLRLRLHGPLPPGRVEGLVNIDIASETMRRLRLPVFAESIWGLHCDLKDIVLGPIPYGDSQMATVDFSHEAGIRLGSIRTSNDALHVQDVQRQGNMVTVILRSAKQLPVGEFHGYLILEVHDGRNREIRLPYRGRVVADQPANATNQAITR